MRTSLRPLKNIMLIFVFSFSSTLFAEEENKEYHTLDQMVGAINLEKKQVENMVDTMVKSGRISADEGSRAKREIASVKDEDVETFKLEAVKKLKQNNYAANNK